MDTTRFARGCAIVALGLTLGACSGGGDSTPAGTSTLSVSLMDAPVDGVTTVNVQISAIWLKPAGGDAKQLPLAHAPITVNLLEASDDNAALLIDDAPIEAGKYEWLAMDVNADFDNVFDSFVDMQTGGREELRVPSSRVRLVDGFEIEANQAAKFLFDWDLRKALVAPPGQPGLMLKPAFRMLDVQELGVLRGTVAQETITASGDANGCLADDADLDVGNSVYVFAGDVTPDDIDGTDPDPVAAVPVKVDGSGAYVYRTVLSPGTYTVAFTCQAGLDDPNAGKSEDLKFVGTESLAVTADAEVVVDF